MSVRQHKNNSSGDEKGGILSIILRQLLSGIICAAIILDMHNSHIPTLRACADAFGRALRYDSKWQETAAETIKSLKEILPPYNRSENQPADNNPPSDSSSGSQSQNSPKNGGVTFQ